MKRPQLEQTAFCSQSHSCFSASSTCSNIKIKRLLSLILVTVLLLSMSFPAFAAEPDYSDDSIIEIETYNLYTQMFTRKDNDNTYYNNTIVKERFDIPSRDLHYVEFKNTNDNFNKSSLARVVSNSGFINIKADTHYNIKFGVNSRIQQNYNCLVFARIFQGSTISDIVLFNDLIECAGLGNSTFPFMVDFDFILKSKDIGNSFKIQLFFEITQKANTSNYRNILITDKITVTDLDSNAKWYVRIINAIKAIPDKLRGFFVELGNKITALGDKIGGFFTDLKNNILEQFRNLKQWFIDLGDRIQGFFIELKDNIVQGLKDLFIPHETYFEEKKNELDTWATQHLGAVYQGADIAIDFLRQLLTINPKEPAITMPAIEFEFKGVLYHLTDPIHYSFAWVHDSTHPLFYIYKVYRGFVICALFATFGNYLHRKYYEIFAGGGSE